jgi:hypothetical protein
LFSVTTVGEPKVVCAPEADGLENHVNVSVPEAFPSLVTFTVAYAPVRPWQLNAVICKEWTVSTGGGVGLVELCAEGGAEISAEPPDGWAVDPPP